MGQFQSNLTGGARSQRYYVLEKLVLGKGKHTNEYSSKGKAFVG